MINSKTKYWFSTSVCGQYQRQPVYKCQQLWPHANFNYSIVQKWRKRTSTNFLAFRGNFAPNEISANFPLLFPLPPLLSTFCCNALQKYSKSVSSTQVTILSLLPVETSLNVLLLVWYEQPGVRVSVQTITQSLQARGLELGAIFYD